MSELAHQQRVVIEKLELDQKLDKLHEFINTNPVFRGLSVKAAYLLVNQAFVMQQYSDLLRQRIELF